jgi:pimeloyl-ACP methyl ester carboxylesterase
MDEITNAGSVEIRGLKLAETSAGTISFREAGSGEALLFLHGMNGSSKSWAYQFGAFAEKYRVIAWDAPGYGRSDPVAAEADAYAAQVDRLLTHLGIDQVVIVGHSMGGVIAERFCARYAYRAKRLVLSGTHWGNAAPADAPLARKYTKRLEELEALPAREYGEARAKKMLPESCPPEAFKLVAEIAAEARREGLLNGGRMVEKTDNRPFLSSLNLPVLILTGEHDTVVLPERSEAMLAYLPNARAVSLPGVGHAAYLEAPEVFNETVRQFIEADVK